jgi:hypothetical protein
MLIFFKILEVTYNIQVEKLRLDNSGENIKMSEAIEAEGYNVTFEFISPGSPQYNGVVERMFTTLFGMVFPSFYIVVSGLKQQERRLICRTVLSLTRVINLPMGSLWV